MQFTYPAALWLMLLVPLPLLLTRRWRPVARRAVSNLHLWRAVDDRSSGRIALRRRRRGWRVALQMACIATLVAALGGPVVTSGGGGTALVFDVSASMTARHDGVTRFGDARARARDIVQGLPAFARVQLIAAAASPRELGEWTASDPRLVAALDALSPTAGTADVPAAVDAAARRGARHIIVFSDTAAATDRRAGLSQPSVRSVRVGQRADNVAVTRVAARATAHGGRSGEVLVGVYNYGLNARETDVDISVDGRLAHRVRVRLEPARAQSVSVALSDLGHIVTARLLGEDALSVDDTRSAASLRTPVRVAFLGSRGSFVHHALEVNAAVALRVYDPSTGAEQIDQGWSNGDFDVAVCDRCGDFAPMAPVLIVSPPSAETSRGRVALVSASHPLAASLVLGDEIATAMRGPATETGADVVLRVGNVPAVTALDREGRRRIDVHFDLSRHDFVLSPAFPMLIANAVEWLNAPAEIPAETTAGEPLALVLRGTSPSSVPRIDGPDGRPREVRGVRQQYVVGDTDLAGTYRVRIAGSERLAIVNPVVERESDLLAADAVLLHQNEAAEVSIGPSVAVGRSLALLGLALLALEWRFRMAAAP